jgi:hypothetical protein
MSRGRTKGPPPPRKNGRIPTDVADAAEAALDDLLSRDEEILDDDELLTQAIVPGGDPAKPKAPGRPRMVPPPSRAESVEVIHSESVEVMRAESIAGLREESTVDAGAALVELDDDSIDPSRTDGNLPRADSEMSSGSMRVAVLEDSVHLGSVQSAISAAGHQVLVAASGRDGARKIIDTLRERTVDVVLVALPGGDSVIDAVLAHEGTRPVILACVDGSPLAATQRAVTANADLVALRPHDVSSLAPLLFAAARLAIERRVTAAVRGAEQALRARLDELADPEPRGLLPFEMFQRVLELEIKRAKRFEYALSVALFYADVSGPPPPPGIRGILRARAGNALIHTVRDIDVATQLDHERFLVLLPYTDLKGASGLARRVIAAVGAIDPVVTAGRSMSPKLVGAVATAKLTQAVSFAKLVKDVSRALDGARKDGADLAVVP